MRTLRVQVTLRRVTPPVRRVLDVPAASTMPELHELLQAGVGWTNSHLHEFIVAGLDADPWAGGLVRYGVPDPDVDGVEPVRDEATARMRDLGAAFVYLYDFGDCWAHDVAVLGPGADRAGCVYGGPAPRSRRVSVPQAEPSPGHPMSLRLRRNVAGRRFP
ncbi:plasmid pRiA4b ORF-3 family protein [Pseudonocardia sp. KRD291]|uniref:plasmid pRiA4b ORF-3 family protein n=1 Tax=Pseudonocardia sp. KRD291 TaxID=2792007 RepID=UPI001C4A1A55|nr:plasmid pRiA4b ORF-3 family protein [Pseudonocardia sp. KRD291]MBW0104309.1 plasmid pRiA4b ORF-3 family protein [Pseudonocardia sp. KRD291]